jgi:hypothetical protein
VAGRAPAERAIIYIIYINLLWQTFNLNTKEFGCLVKVAAHQRERLSTCSDPKRISCAAFRWSHGGIKIVV